MYVDIYGISSLNYNEYWNLLKFTTYVILMFSKETLTLQKVISLGRGSTKTYKTKCIILYISCKLKLSFLI